MVALFNTLHRISESLASVEDFRKMYASTQQAELEAARHRTEHRAPSAPSSSWWSASTGLGVVLSVVESLRRGCLGCIEFCMDKLEKGPLADWLGVWSHQEL